MRDLPQELWPSDPWPPCPAPFNLAEHVLRAGAQVQGKTALVCLGPDGAVAEEWRYGDLISAVRGIAAGLADRGLTPGARILMRLGNTAQFPLVYLGAIAAGCVPVPTSAHLTAREITDITAQVDPALVIQDPALSAPEQSQNTRLHSDDLLAMRALAPAPYHMGDPNRPAYIVFTSGTSGTPRGVVHAHRAIWARGMMMEGWYGLKRSDRLLHAGAFNWTFTLGTGLMDPWTRGATALIPAPDTDAAQLPALLARYEASLFAAAPGIYRRMLRSTLPAMPHLRQGLSAGEKLPDAIRAAWRASTGTDIYEAFGMSECSTFVSASPTAPATQGALGRPQAGRRLAQLSSGEIAVHRSDPGLMLGYLNAPEATAACFEGEWFKSGDLVQILPSGDIAYAGRADDMMNAGGFRVSPLEVEDALSTASGLTHIAVTDVEITAGTRVIAAFYTGADDLHESTLRALASQRLARYKQPRVYLRRNVLPVSANGKLQRRVLRDTFEAPQ